MRQSSLSLSSAVAAAYFDSSFVMYSSPRPRPQHYRGGGRGESKRGYSEGPPRPSISENQVVTGDSHFQSVRATNMGFQTPIHIHNNRNSSYSGNSSGNNVAFRGHSYTQRPRPEFHRNSPADFGFRSPAADNQWPQRPFQPLRYNNQQQQQPPRRPKRNDYRRWEFSRSPPPPKYERFSVLSYNILAAYLAHTHRSKLYFHIPRHFLDWEWRRRSIVFELGLWSSDIMCFQEVDKFGDLEEDLKNRGYMGIWKMRTGNPVDGCAVFWRTSRFKLVHEEYIEFNKLGMRDNVAQICVLESRIHNDVRDQSTLTKSPTGCNKVVVCNIHVLYNPKRGEIKLGQVRVLLDKAQAVSKIWNDAPVVICGDFNCTPKSPLYNFIAEQKLDLSEIARDKVSGQASAEIAPQAREIIPSSEGKFTPSSVPVPASAAVEDMGSGSRYNIYSRKQLSSQSHSENKVPSAAVLADSTKDAKLRDSFSDAHNNVKNITKDTVGQPVSLKNIDPESSSVEVTFQTFQDEVSLSKDQIGAASHASDDHLMDSQSAYSTDRVDSADQSIDANDKISEYTTTGEKVDSSFAERNQEDRVTPSQFEMHVEVQGMKCEREKSTAAADNLFIKEGSSEELSSLPVVNEADASTLLEENTSDASLAVDVDVSENFEGLSLEEFDDNAENQGEDSQEFLADLLGDDIMGNSPSGIDSDLVDVEKLTYDLSLWTPMEIATATGNADCTLVQHPLKLKSTYAEVEGSSESRESSGEPVMTSYNTCFLGTVDYIWRSEGLQTVRVLAPLPKNAVQWTKGFPTRKWGSDHIAIVSELAFIKDSE